jgi:hypothetical protein
VVHVGVHVRQFSLLDRLFLITWIGCGCLEFIMPKQFVLAILAEAPYALEFAAEALHTYKEFVLAAVTLDGSALNFASEALQSDKEVVLAAVTQHGQALYYVHCMTMTENGHPHRLAAEALCADKEVVLAAVTEAGCALEYAAAALRADKEVVLAAVAQHGRALLYAVPALAQHTALQQIAHLSRHWALELANQRLRLALLASASGRGCTIAALSADIIELVGAHITRDTVVRSLVARHHYWPACEPPPPTKKQKA